MAELKVQEMPLAELLNKSSGGRQPSPRDLALDELVMKASLPANAETAFQWAYAPDKRATATLAAERSITRTGQVGKVFASTKGDVIYFSQQPLRKPRKS